MNPSPRLLGYAALGEEESMKKRAATQLVTLESAIQMFREDAWPTLIQGIPQEELSTGIACYLNRFAVGRRRIGNRGHAHRSPLSTLD
jgi:hypothetical protein